MVEILFMDQKPISVIVAGTRDFIDKQYLWSVLDRYLSKRDPKTVTILDGKARGPDTFGGEYGEAKGMRVLPYPADWDKHGKSAGFIRNEEMAKAGTHLIAFWDGVSTGTKDMIDRAMAHGLTILVIKIKPEQIDSSWRDKKAAYRRNSGNVSRESNRIYTGDRRAPRPWDTKRRIGE